MNNYHCVSVEVAVIAAALVLAPLSGFPQGEECRFSLDQGVVFDVNGGYVCMGGALDIVGEIGDDGSPTEPYRVFCDNALCGVVNGAESPATNSSRHVEMVVTSNLSSFDSRIVVDRVYGSAAALVTNGVPMPKTLGTGVLVWKHGIEEVCGGEVKFELGRELKPGELILLKYVGDPAYRVLAGNACPSDAVRSNAGEAMTQPLFGIAYAKRLWHQNEKVDSLEIEGVVKNNKIIKKATSHYSKEGRLLVLKSISFKSGKLDASLTSLQCVNVLFDAVKQMKHGLGPFSKDLIAEPTPLIAHEDADAVYRARYRIADIGVADFKFVRGDGCVYLRIELLLNSQA